MAISATTSSSQQMILAYFQQKYGFDNIMVQQNPIINGVNIMAEKAGCRAALTITDPRMLEASRPTAALDNAFQKLQEQLKRDTATMPPQRAMQWQAQYNNLTMRPGQLIQIGSNPNGVNQFIGNGNFNDTLDARDKNIEGEADLLHFIHHYEEHNTRLKRVIVTPEQANILLQSTRATTYSPNTRIASMFGIAIEVQHQ